MSLQGLNVLILVQPQTGASMGFGEAIANSVAQQGATYLILFARSGDKVQALAVEIQEQHPSSRIIREAVDNQSYEAVNATVQSSTKALGQIDILINNADLTLGAPARAFPTS
ncbi:NAD(P)-binding protein [Aspergillus homomorphus CBS 101889]|uniref:NAD(P)-binding protein n=1 Tax=Aspergillus homomorphus (strain CBS 101889) TaxID=1450537 RepID=A0A395I4J1_ASPHC|nr:NAD(P)-binding protein [Aspergillus homomorphus CBS 101889]RAL14666.1 NAD(P)-binding protein [Aspergillus homomorphus CBS 101889]